ncbi:MAG TPA: GlsB/YeaQ/YmgE family stress response membrane protein [Planctomycetaceae bacterium]|nr:GlsB/YeaQ/YmgE family stress response membrane protein [Planctomycetaceae bacterium]
MRSADSINFRGTVSIEVIAHNATCEAITHGHNRRDSGLGGFRVDRGLRGAGAVYPGRQPIGLGITMILGIVGSLIGGFVAWAVNGGPERGVFDGAGWIMSIVGALIVVRAGLAFEKQIDPTFVITHRVPLSDDPAAYRTFRDKQDECIKVVLKP